MARANGCQPAQRPPARRRAAAHAGSWYDARAGVLGHELGAWLGAAKDAASDSDPPAGAPVRAIIAPHAGYRFSGETAAHAYAALSAARSRVRRVFVLGPSHHWFTRRCALSQMTSYETPLGDLAIDADTYAALRETGKFDTMSKQVDEDEHSIEMHLPYIVKCVEPGTSVVPILVGALTPSSEAEYGALLAPYLADDANFFVVSSDFCHWGRRFNYTFHDPCHGAIHRSIEALDRQGMDEIESGDPRGFTRYLTRFENTICGRHPIGVMMNMVEVGRKRGGAALSTRFVKYAQSSQCMSTADSSVSYASAVVYET